MDLETTCRVLWVLLRWVTYRVRKVRLHRVQGTFGGTNLRFEGAVLPLHSPWHASIHGDFHNPITLDSSVVVPKFSCETIEVVIEF